MKLTDKQIEASIRKTDAARNQLRDEYKERVKIAVDRYINSQGVSPDQIDSYIAKLDQPALQKLAKVLYLQLQQLAQIVKETK